MSGPQSRESADLSAAVVRRAEKACDRFEAAWKAGERPRIEDHLAAVPDAERPALLPELILLEIDYRRLAGDRPAAEEFLARFPTLDGAWLVAALPEPVLPTVHCDPEVTARPGPFPQICKFVLLQVLGKGGCGTVWRALDTELDRVVAVKIPDAGLMTSPAHRARFRREARAAARLSHPNVVTLFEVAQAGDTPLLVMEYVEGTDLGRLVEQSGPLPIPQACDCVRQAALGLQHAHERGLVHRDVKPANLLLTAPHSPLPSGERGVGGMVKVLDLGLARLLHRPDDAATNLTALGAVMGTANFMAPEQACDSSTADARADVYSLGCTLYYLLTGQVPFPGGTAAEKMMRHLTQEPPPVERLQPAVPPALAALVHKMMARRPEDRYQSAAEVVAALTAVVGAVREPAPSSDAGPPEGPPPPEAHAGAATRAVPPGRLRRQPAAETGSRLERYNPDKVPPRGLRRRHAVVLLAGLAALLVLVLRPWERQPFLTNSIGMKLRLIRPGQFRMGSPPDEPGRFAREGPVHAVELTRPYYIGVYEVTQGEFAAVLRYNPSHFCAQGEGKEVVKGLDTSRFPVDRVTWKQAQDFCDALSALPAERQAGRAYRLPTEAEWEYACRAGSQEPYYFGRSAKDLGDHAWFTGNAGGRTHPVGEKKPNAWGLYDMYGNVWEWCADFYQQDYYRTGPPKNPFCNVRTDRRVLRGGGWGEFGRPPWCRSATRGMGEPADVKSIHGLRVAFTAPKTALEAEPMGGKAPDE